ncbi:LacI family DNA-binding transcriptional regulator [Cypionkella sp.]|uniref:LacI family DNA-binding transcriptional regulator n=1 Tax=Cypionkella sp. TaxID=2811411 RepID=UPI00261A00D6|nr:LacI family DNA-binding transcriptional regulator [Cypionkella sp.]
MKKPSLLDIATAAGVGSATVERVLNGRGGVKPETVERVLNAARVLDSPRRLPSPHTGLRRIDVVLVRPETTFYARLGQSFKRIAASLDPASPCCAALLMSMMRRLLSRKFATHPIDALA